MRSASTAACLVLAFLALALPRLRAADAPKEDKLVPLNKGGTVLLDAAGKRLLLKTEVCLREGALEMLVCLKQTKEHESILALDGKAQIVHAGLLALGANPGMPVQFSPEYRPPTGQKIEIFLQWADADGKLQRVPAKSWVRHATRRYWAEKLDSLPPDLELPEDGNLKYDEKHKELLWYGPMTDEERDELLALSKDKKYQAAIRAFHEQGQSREMKAEWIFAGSSFYVDEATGRKAYQAEGGDLICVSNFSTATIDVSIESSASENQQVFEAWTERIPPLGTPVTVELIPVFDAAPVKKSAAAASSGDSN